MGETAHTTGEWCRCATCSGYGLVQHPNRFDPSPEECRDCGGSGRVWQYLSGALARYPGGPFVGRAERSPS
jgi:DnaJ-class molecular chaperone